jgi:hypothetical protein
MKKIKTNPMKNTKPTFRNDFNLGTGLNTILTLAVFFLSTLSYTAMAQIQRGLPKPSDPIDLTDTTDLVIFILLPALVIILYFFWRRAIKKRKEKRKRNDID